MRSEMIVGGVILVIISIVGYSMMKGYTQDCVNSINTKSPVPSYLNQICDLLVLVRYGALFAVVVGFGMIVYGCVVRKKISENESERIR